MDSAGMQACLRMPAVGHLHRAYALQREGAKRNRAGAWLGDGMHVLMRKLKEAAKWHLHRSLQPVWS